MWPDPSGFPYRREAAILSYNVNVYRPLATAPSRTRLSHTLLFPAELNLGGDDSFPGSWKVVLTYKWRESFHKSDDCVVVAAFRCSESTWERLVSFPPELIVTPNFLFSNILVKDVPLRETPPLTAKNTNVSEIRTQCTNYSEGGSTITDRRVEETKEQDSSIINAWGEDVTKRTAPTTTSVNITAN